jgi:hypothetical protein
MRCVEACRSWFSLRGCAEIQWLIPFMPLRARDFGVTTRNLRIDELRGRQLNPVGAHGARGTCLSCISRKQVPCISRASLGH